MVERVDAGPIIGADLFDIAPATTVQQLEETAIFRLSKLFWQLAGPLATQPTGLQELPIRWGGIKSTCRLCATACDIPLNISEDELSRRVRAFGCAPAGLCPTITLHGIPFRMVAAP
jgi:methionyl-tRNA formyltransferase